MTPYHSSKYRDSSTPPSFPNAIDAEWLKFEPRTAEEERHKADGYTGNVMDGHAVQRHIAVRQLEMVSKSLSAGGENLSREEHSFWAASRTRSEYDQTWLLGIQGLVGLDEDLVGLKVIAAQSVHRLHCCKGWCLYLLKHVFLD